MCLILSILCESNLFELILEHRKIACDYEQKQDEIIVGSYLHLADHGQLEGIWNVDLTAVKKSATEKNT